jgi:L,D-peptidoglycan transpeptidase YkuD (ErfK/YbiS/YcfS/YnhG family)
MASGYALAAFGLAALSTLGSTSALAQQCPAPLAAAQRLVLVTAETMNATAATLQLFERDSAAHAWRAAAPAEPAVIGRAGMGWSHFFRQLARPGEPIKVEGDKRAPAGVYPIGRSFGTLASARPDYLQVTGDTVCVYEPASPAYNRITSRAGVRPGVSVENMSRMLPMYRRGLVVDYPTNARARAGSCIFIHVWRSPTTGTAGCVALPEARVEALQDFSAAGAVIAILPRPALARLPGCLPSASQP